MTQILTVACRQFTVQVSDRLVTQGAQEFDRLANKVLIYGTVNAVVAIGYAGLAYLDRLPTDEWIAQRIWGRPFVRRDGRPTMALGGKPNRKDIGLALRALRSDLQQAVRNLAHHQRRESLEITIAGWQCSRRMVRSIVAEIVKPRDQVDVELREQPRYWDRTGQIVLCESGGWFTNEDYKFFERQLQEVRKQPPPDRPDAMIGALAENIRRIAARNRAAGRHVIGYDLMTIMLPPPGHGPIRIRFLPSNVHEAILQSGEERRILEVFYSPWVIGPAALVPPSMRVGSQIVSSGTLEVDIEGAPPPATGGLYQPSLIRTREPNRAFRWT